MSAIVDVIAREILDSRGNPTIEAEVVLESGSYTEADMEDEGLHNDDISSVKVPAGYKVTLYSNDDFSGPLIVLTSDAQCLIEKDFNDVTSSIKVEKTDAENQK